MRKSRLIEAAMELAATTTEAGHNIWDDAVEGAVVILLEAQCKAAPLARKAGKRTADFASKRPDIQEPYIRDVPDRVPPAADAVYERVTSELLSNLQQALHKTAGHKPVPAEKQKRKGGRFEKFVKLAFISSLIVDVVVATRYFLAPRGNGWAAHEPPHAYISNNDTFVTAARSNEPVTPTPQPTTSIPEAPKESFDEDSYVGPNPSEGYIFKDGERLKKYHISGTRDYELIIVEIWSNPEEAAEVAGSTKAQH